MFNLSPSYKKQALALFPGWLLMLAGGSYLSYGVFSLFGYWSWIDEKQTSELIFLAISFHVTTIVGAIVGCLSYNKVEIRYLHLANCGLMLISALLVISVPSNYACIVISRLMSGLGFGCSYVTSIIYGSEISSPKVRAHFIYMLHLFLTFGMFFYSAAYLLANSAAAAVRSMAAIAIAMIVQSIPVGFFTIKSSHIYLMQTNPEAALERYQHFQDDTSETTRVECEALQAFVFQEKNRSFEFIGKRNATALLIVSLAVVGYLVVFNDLQNFHRLYYVSFYLSSDTKGYAMVTMMGVRLIGCIIGLFVLDRVPRKLHYFVPALMVSVLMFVFGILVRNIDFTMEFIWLPTLLYVPLEFLIGFGFGPIADILRAELFQLKEKPILVAATVAIGEILHIIFVVILVPSNWIEFIFNLFFKGAFRNIPFVSGAITLICGIGILFFLKSPTKQSLRN